MVARQDSYRGDQPGRDVYKPVNPGWGVTKVGTILIHLGDYLVSSGQIGYLVSRRGKAVRLSSHLSTWALACFRYEFSVSTQQPLYS